MREPDHQAKRRLIASLVHVGRSQILVALVLCLVAMAVVMQVRAKNADSSYQTARRADLIELLDGLGQESRRLEGEIGDLERTRERLRSGNDSERVARQEAASRVGNLAILAGTAPAQGPGIRMTITDPGRKLSAHLLLDAVEEMRDAGAEVIELNDTVRVIYSSWFTGAGDALQADGRTLRTPLVVEVIGDPHALEEAARFRGGIVTEVTGAGVRGDVRIERVDLITVNSVHEPPQQEFAKPVR